jgi:hypothetical protein
MSGLSAGNVANRRWIRLLPFAGLPLLLLANYFLRHTLEESQLWITSFFESAYPMAEKIVFSDQHRWWQYFLPEPRFTGSWTTTTLILTRFVELRLTPAVTWYLFNGILVASSFFLSWYVFRSFVFSYTFAICFAFGTQLYHTYAVSGSIGFCLLFVYYQVLLVCLYKVITAERRRPAWWAAFAVALVVTALAYEGWLDFLVFVWIAAIYLAVIFLHSGRRRELRRMLTAVAAMTIVGGVYVYIKTLAGYGQVRGAESDVVFNYTWLAPAIEDVISNVFTHLYIVLTMFLPPVLVSSTSLLTVGPQQLVAEQYGYHLPAQYLVAMHHVFLWRYYAGIAFAVLVGAVALCIRRSWIEPGARWIVPCVFLIMVAVGGPTHDFIKFRPMKSMPLLGYHAMVGNLGMALLVAYLMMAARRALRNTFVFTLIAVAVWGTTIYAALSRPAMMKQMAAQVGLGENLYPDPSATLSKLLGTKPPALAPTVYYRLEPYRDPATEPSSFDDTLPPLPELLPVPTLWTRGERVSVWADQFGFVVQGNATQLGAQLSSPPVAVRPRQHLLLRIVARVDQGQVCVGVLGQDPLQWMLPPSPPQTEYALYTGDNTAMTIVVANCYPDTARNVPTRLLWNSASLARLESPPSTSAR